MTNIQILTLFLFVIIIVVGLLPFLKRFGLQDYFLSGRTITLPFFIFSITSTRNIGMINPLDYISSSTFNNILLGVPFYTLAIIFALFVAKHISNSPALTIPEHVIKTYNKNTALICAILILLIFSPIAYTFMLGKMIKIIFGLDKILCVVIAVLISSVYLFFNGFSAIKRISIITFLLFSIAISLTLANILSLDFLDIITSSIKNLNVTDFQYSNVEIYILSALWIFIDPIFYQRCASAKNEKTAKSGIIISVIFWFILDSATILSGTFKSDNTNIGLYNIADTVFMLGLTASLITLLSSYLLVCGFTFGNDIIGKLKNLKEEKIFVYVKVGIIFTIILASIISLFFTKTINYLPTLLSCLVPTLLFIVISSYFKKAKIPQYYMYGGIINSLFVSLLSYISGHINSVNGYPIYFFNVQPIYLGLFMATFWLVLGKLDKNKKATT